MSGLEKFDSTMTTDKERRSVGCDATALLVVEQALEFWVQRAEYYDGVDDGERDHQGGRRRGGGIGGMYHKDDDDGKYSATKDDAETSLGLFAT